MTSALFDYTYEDDDDPMLTNILNGNLLSEHHTFYDLPERDLLDIAGEHTPQMLAGFSTFSERNRAFFAPIVWPSALVSLPDELLGHIAENLPTVDLLTLTLTSKKLRHASIPSIYRDVDLSIHNRGRLVYGSKQEDNYLWQYSSSYRCEDVRSRAFTRQEQFLQQVIEHPEYAKYVKSLSWTLLLLREPEWGEDYPTESAVIAERPILHIWEVFEKLTNVRWLDLAWLSHDHDRPLASQFPDVLFPRAR